MNTPSPSPGAPLAGAESAERQKLEALRQVTNGIAPAFSDLITVMRGQAGVLLAAADTPGTMQGLLRQIEYPYQTRGLLRLTKTTANLPRAKA